MLELMHEGMTLRQAQKYVRRARKEDLKQRRREALLRLYEESMPRDAESTGEDDSSLVRWMKAHRGISAALTLLLVVVMLVVWTAVLHGSVAYSFAVFLVVVGLGAAAAWWGRRQRR
ncbi:hypothetical protein SAMN04489745_0117 [Arthrobacter woluwensis]|uniref:DUF3040 domain-containing protein n=1 Tax=Arthrobacter woluwensis TaxID=156980 RepID=A0A1H4I7W9_9MICC|nr:hypothetical protein SAMN04489745_0117 [Arthrobacter woluwensis]